MIGASAYRRAVVHGLALLAIGTLLMAASNISGHSRSGSVMNVIRVCADPNNLPFSNEKQEGFENRLAALLAADLGVRPQYTWRAQRRGFVRSTLEAGLCDVVMGLPRGHEHTLTTRPYYRSTYVFVARRDRQLRLQSLDDPRLRDFRLGVQLVGDDFANSPPAHALSARGLTRNIVGYSVLGDYARPNPPARIVEAVARGDIDAALVWGPLAGFFAKRSDIPLELRNVIPDADAGLPFAFDISMAVRRDDAARLGGLDDFIVRRRQDIDAILLAFGVPQVEAPPMPGKPGKS
jgi:mxaJ protein